MIKQLQSSPTGNFFLLAGPCVIEGEHMALDIAEKAVEVTSRLGIPYVFKGSYRKANRSRIDSFTGIGDEAALKILRKVADSFHIPVVTDIHTNRLARGSGTHGQAGEYQKRTISLARSHAVCRAKSARRWQR